MNSLRRGAAIAGAAVLLVSLVGCGSGALVTGATSSLPSPTQTAVPKAAATTPVAKPVAVPATPSASACAGTPAGIKHIYVSIGEQHLWACTGPALLTESAVTTGASALTNVHDATPTGDYRITSKARNTVLAGHDVNGSWRDPVTYWMPFDGGDGFHDSPWQTFPLGSPLYTTQGSHGCIHVALDALATIFGWAPVGTLVTIRN